VMIAAMEWVAWYNDERLHLASKIAGAVQVVSASVSSPPTQDLPRAPHTNQGFRIGIRRVRHQVDQLGAAQ